MTDAPWYRYSDLPPPYTVMTRWQMAGRIFVGIRKRGERGKDLFCDAVTGQVVSIEGYPELWQPLKPEAWSAPLPAPVVASSAGIMTTERMKFGAVEAASSAELAREMERDRAHANSSRKTDGFHGKPEQPEARWWRDISNIKYEPKGEVSQRMAEARVMRALAWCGAGKPMTVGGSPMTSLVREIGEEAARALAEIEQITPPDVAPRFRPLPLDHKDFDVAMGWFVALNPPELWNSRRLPWGLSRLQRVILWRSLATPLSFAEIAHECRWMDYQRAQQAYADGIDKVWRAANGKRVHKQLKVRDQIAALRERNRASKRRAA